MMLTLKGGLRVLGVAAIMAAGLTMSGCNNERLEGADVPRLRANFVHLVYTDRQAIYRRSGLRISALGSTTETVFEDPTRRVLGVSTALHKEKLTVAWLEHDGSLHVKVDGSPVHPVTTTVSPDRTRPALLSIDDRLIVAWGDGSTVFASISSDDGRSWSFPRSLSFTKTVGPPDAVVFEGSPVIALPLGSQGSNDELALVRAYFSSGEGNSVIFLSQAPFQMVRGIPSGFDASRGVRLAIASGRIIVAGITGILPDSMRIVDVEEHRSAWFIRSDRTSFDELGWHASAHWAHAQALGDWPYPPITTNAPTGLQFRSPPYAVFQKKTAGRLDGQEVPPAGYDSSIADLDRSVIDADMIYGITRNP
ncbi:MAG: hypothetical protein AAFX05_06160 [Planctomycetota bacterium]